MPIKTMKYERNFYTLTLLVGEIENLEKKGYDVSILDSACEGYDNIISGEYSDIYGLSDEDLIKRIKEENNI